MNSESEDDDLYRILQIMLMGSYSVLLGQSFLDSQEYKKSKNKTVRSRVRPISANRLQQGGDYYNLMSEMRLFDKEMFFHYTRFTIEQFDTLLSFVGPLITKKSHRTPLNPEHRLAITLRFLATGSAFQTLAFQFRVGKTTVFNIVHETCSAIWKALRQRVLIKPSKSNWEKIAQNFEHRWKFPHCIGALDGRHVRIQAPSKANDRKQFLSILLLAMCDANYKFTYIDLGSADCGNDCGTFNKSSLGNMLQSGKLDLPAKKKIGNYNDCEFPYFIVADEAFPLKENIMRPYPGRSEAEHQLVFNYRLSRAKKIIENTFGVLVSRWKIFQGPIIGKEENVGRYILATMSLHNFLLCWKEKFMEPGMYCPPEYVDQEIDGEVRLGEWRQHVYDGQLLQPLSRMGSNNAARKFYDTRNHLSYYFMSEEGSIPEQEKYLPRGTKRKRIVIY